LNGENLISLTDWQHCDKWIDHQNLPRKQPPALRKVRADRGFFTVNLLVYESEVKPEDSRIHKRDNNWSKKTRSHRTPSWRRNQSFDAFWIKNGCFSTSVLFRNEQ
jgi:hypothetical protein